MAWNGHLLRNRIAGTAATLLLLGSSLSAQEPGWIQDDLPAALKQAKQAGSPVFVVFR